jgi:hypothetical protein
MLSRLISFAQSKWSFAVICAAWAVSLAFVIGRGWVWENGDSSSGHGFEIRSDFFEIHRTREFVWLSLILASYGAYYLKKRSIRAFGCLEISAGILAGYFDVSTVPFNQIDAWIALVLAAYAVVSGAENISEGS